jgi:hypothetical protein
MGTATRGQKTYLTGRSPLRRQRSALDCSVIEEYDTHVDSTPTYFILCFSIHFSEKGFTRLSKGSMVRKMFRPLVYIKMAKHISKPGKVVTSQYTCMFSMFIERSNIKTC